MVGHRVRLLLEHTSAVDARRAEITGTLHKLDQSGAVIWREGSLPEQGNTFVPMHRIHEIVDLGRLP